MSWSHIVPDILIGAVSSLDTILTWCHCLVTSLPVNDDDDDDVIVSKSLNTRQETDRHFRVCFVKLSPLSCC